MYFLPIYHPARVVHRNIPTTGWVPGGRGIHWVGQVSWSCVVQRADWSSTHTLPMPYVGMVSTVLVQLFHSQHPLCSTKSTNIMDTP